MQSYPQFLESLLNEYIDTGEGSKSSPYELVFLLNSKYLIHLNVSDLDITDKSIELSMELDENSTKELTSFIDSLSLTFDKYSSEDILSPYKKQINQIIVKNSKIIVKTYNKKFDVPIDKSIIFELLNDKYFGSFINKLYYENEKTVYLAYLGDFVVIDNENKSISLIDHTKRVNTAMGTYKGNATFILINFEFSMGVTEFNKVSKYLINGKYKDYTITDEVYSTQEKENIEKSIKVIQYSNQNQIVHCFHGTSLAIWKTIQKSGYLEAGKGIDYSDKISGHSENNIYFTLDKNIAQKYAVRAAKTSAYVILKLEIPYDSSKFVFDEDSVFKGVNKFLKTAPKNVVSSINKLVGTELKNHNELGPNFDTNYLDASLYKRFFQIYFKNPEKVSKDLKLAISYVFSYCLKSLEENSFAYKGKIPVRNIQVYAEGKSLKYSDSDSKETYGDKYDETVKNYKLLKK
jgi:hypothetical protein